MEKILDEESINKIVELYQTTVPKIAKIASIFKVGNIRIKNILKDRGIELNKRGRQVTEGFTEKLARVNVIFRIPSEGKKLIAVCKQTSCIIEDPNNYAGFLTKHINKLYGDIEIPSNGYQMKLYEYRNGKKWFDKYFDIIEIDANETRKCSLCEWATLDIKNKTGCFENHIKDKHQISIDEYLTMFPKEITLHPISNNKQKKNLLMLEDGNYVTCMICNKKMEYVNETHLLKIHGITSSQYKLKFPSSKLMSDRLLKIFKNSARDANLNMKPTWTSRGEIELKEYIESLGLVVEKSRNRHLLNGKEIDLIIPLLKIGLEYNGLYYHTEKMGKNSTYHLNKTISCNESGYRLIHIFEDEWVVNKDLVKSKLRHIFGLNEGVILHARKIEIKHISKIEKSEFLNTFHIQGNDSSEINYGGFFNNELIGIMTFNGKRNMTSNDYLEYTLSRFAINNNYIITGLASRFIKNFIREYNPKSIISFADRRWTSNITNMYLKLGFELVDIGRPDYKYYNAKLSKYKRLHKFGFGLNQLKRKYPSMEFFHLDGTPKSERELTTELGYDRIWDCGLFKYKLVIN